MQSLQLILTSLVYSKKTKCTLLSADAVTSPFLKNLISFKVGIIGGENFVEKVLQKLVFCNWSKWVVFLLVLVYFTLDTFHMYSG